MNTCMILTFLCLTSIDVALLKCIYCYVALFQDDLVGKDIYNYIHNADRTKFSSILLPMSLGN